MSTVGEYLKELSTGNEQARAEEFSNQSEAVFLTHFGFKYALNPVLLKRISKFQEILTFLKREAGNENEIKKKRKKSPKRNKSAKK